LALETDIILMDEPFAALDEQSRILLGDELVSIWRQVRRTIVFVTHSLTEAVYLGQRIAVFTARPGRIQLDIANDLPRPRAIIWQMVEIVARASNVPDFYANAWLTVAEILIAYALAALFGVLTGITVASSRVIGDAFEPLLLILYAVPKIILYPVIVLMIGTGPATKIVFGVFVGIFVIIFNTAAGLRQVEPNYLRLAHSLGYGKA